MADFQVTSYANNTGMQFVDMITAPIPMPFNPMGMSGGKLITDANKQSCRIIKIKRWGLAKTGNAHTAKWRKVHGGGFCQPLNSKFKSKNARG